jgi:hypothetical protein
MNLKDQLYDCLPAGRYALAGLLRLLDVAETDAVPTAAVECRAQPRLLVNPRFVARHAATPEKLMMLAMHEIHHVLLGHTRRLPVSSEADNFVFDCVINALLSRMFPQPEYTALFRDFYPDDRFPQCLLRLPQGWDPCAGMIPVPPAIAGRLRGGAAIRDVYRALYSREGASYEQIRSILPQLQVKAEQLGGVPLLGSHDEPAAGVAASDATVFAQAVGELVSRWPAPPEPLKGRSLTGMPRDSRILPHAMSSNRQRLRRLICSIAGMRAEGGARPVPGEHVMEIESPLPAAERRAVVCRALGVAPLFYRRQLAVPRSVPAGRRVHVYLDVSGSMDGIKGAVYGAVLDCAQWVVPQIHLFSDRVAEAGLQQLRQGFCRSTGGTDIACVAGHMKKHGVRYAILITDGYVGTPGPADAAVLRQVRLGVAYVGQYGDVALKPYVKNSVVLQTTEGGRT